MMIRKKLIFFVIIMLHLCIAHAGDYGDGKYGAGLYGTGIGEVAVIDDPGDTGGSAGGGNGGSGGGGGAHMPEQGCLHNSDCEASQYCFENECYNADCSSDGDCKEDEVCHHLRCVKLFDVVIKEFESPIKLGDFFDFTYLIKGMADFNNDVIISFSIEKDGMAVTSGQDVIYLGSFEEKIRTTKLFLPSTVASGVYTFSVEATYGNYKAKSFRIIEIVVGEEGVAEINLLSEKQPLVGSAVEWGRNKFHPFLLENLYFILTCFGILILSIVIIVLFKKRSKESNKKQRKNKGKQRFSYREKVINTLKRIKK